MGAHVSLTAFSVMSLLERSNAPVSVGGWVVDWEMYCPCMCSSSLIPADTEDVCIVERLFSSSLVAIVSLKAPRKLKVCHFKKGTEICNYSYSNTILAVKLNRQVRGTSYY